MIKWNVIYNNKIGEKYDRSWFSEKSFRKVVLFPYGYRHSSASFISPIPNIISIRFELFSEYPSSKIIDD